jgi:hypothetical protein
MLHVEADSVVFDTPDVLTTCIMAPHFDARRSALARELERVGEQANSREGEC